MARCESEPPARTDVFSFGLAQVATAVDHDGNPLQSVLLAQPLHHFKIGSLRQRQTVQEQASAFSLGDDAPQRSDGNWLQQSCPALGRTYYHPGSGTAGLRTRAPSGWCPTNPHVRRCAAPVLWRLLGLITTAVQKGTPALQGGPGWSPRPVAPCRALEDQ